MVIPRDLDDMLDQIYKAREFLKENLILKADTVLSDLDYDIRRLGEKIEQ